MRLQNKRSFTFNSDEVFVTSRAVCVGPVIVVGVLELCAGWMMP